MRIGIFTETYKPHISGVVNSIDMLKKGLEENDHEVFIVTLSNPHNKEFHEDSNIIRFKGKSYPLKQLKEYSYTNFYQSKAKQLMKYKFDVIHIQTEFSIGNIGIKCAKLLNVPIVFTFHTNYEDYFHYVTKNKKIITNIVLMKYLKYKINYYNKKVDCFIVPTKKVKKIFNSYGYDFPVEIIPTGIDVDLFNKKYLDINTLDNIKDKYYLRNKFVFGFIGRVSPEKSIDMLIRAFSKIKQDNVVLLICGNGTAFDDLIKLTDELKINKSVIFTNMIDYKEIPFYYNCIDVFVNASFSETQGLTYIEALAASVPLLVKKDDALNDLLIEYENGLYFNNEEELLTNMNLLFTNENLLRHMKEKASSTISNYTRQRFSNEVEKIYKNLIINK